MTVEIPLTQGKTAIVDECDAWLLELSWHAKRTARGVYYAGTNVRLDRGKFRWESMHRFILKPAPGLVVDHIDGDGLNNRRANLRACTQAENMRNRRPWTGKRFLGVTWDKQRSKFRVQCGNTHHGDFEDEIEAARVYDQAAVAAYGEFARLNFPQISHKNATG